MHAHSEGNRARPESVFLKTVTHLSRHDAWVRVLVVVICFVICTGTATAVEVPTLQHYVNDQANRLSQAEWEQLERMLEAYDRTTSSQYVVLIIPSLEGESIEDFSMAVAEKNRIGKKGKDNGLLFLVVVNDRKMRFEVGYGLESVLTDALTSTIISEIIAPEFRSGRYAAGITAGMDAAMKAASGEFTAPEPRPESRKKSRGTNGIVFFIILLFILIRIGRRKGRGGGIWFLGGPWGGSSGGGFSGGGGFGGFSGGGGSFGGGGSSGSW
jgi:uncharacterized protein